MPPLLLTQRTSYDSMGYSNRIPNGSHNCQGASKAQGSKAKLAVRSVSPRVNRAREKLTQRLGSSWHFLGPIEGIQHPQALYLSLGQEVSFTPLCVGWHLTIRVFQIGITRESRLKPPGQDLPKGHLPISGPMERYFFLLALTCA
jgi:hypothetical protein